VQDLSPRLGARPKLAYGIGLAAEGIKNSAFNTFLLFYYQQLVGLDPALCGLALFVALCVDAVLDPLIGAWSDSFRSPLGRRHPFMYAAIVPLCLCFWLAFRPPLDMSTLGKFSWLLVFAVGTRVSMALFLIPHLSLVPELTHDFGERTSLTSLRTVFGWIFGLLNGLLGYAVFLKATPEYPQGLLNAAGYGPFSVFGAVVMFVAMSVCALGTQKVAREAHERRGVGAHPPLSELPRAIKRALSGQAYRSVVLAGLFLSVAFGMTENLNNYMNTFFWGFTSVQVSMFIVVIFVASLFVLSISRPLLARFGSRNVAVGCGVVMTVIGPVFIGLRLAGFMPEVGGSALLTVLSVGVFFSYGAIILGTAVLGKMIADVSDQYELETNTRQEGMLFSASMFLTKAASGLGTFVSGLIIKTAHFPEGATLKTVSTSAIAQLGIGSALGTLLLGSGAIYFFARFNLRREDHEHIVSELIKRRDHQGSIGQVVVSSLEVDEVRA
jgi:Na+/melibiose symporter-like transporter